MCNTRKKGPKGKDVGDFFPIYFYSSNLNEKFDPQMNIVRTFFSKIKALYFKFRRWAGETSPSLSSYAPVDSFLLFYLISFFFFIYSFKRQLRRFLWSIAKDMQQNSQNILKFNSQYCIIKLASWCILKRLWLPTLIKNLSRAKS